MDITLSKTRKLKLVKLNIKNTHKRTNNMYKRLTKNSATKCITIRNVEEYELRKNILLDKIITIPIMNNLINRCDERIKSGEAL